MKAKSTLSSITLLIIILKAFLNVQCAYRQNAVKIFDKYSLIDLVQKYYIFFINKYQKNGNYFFNQM